MKKITHYLIAISFVLTLLPYKAIAATSNKVASQTEQAKELVNRLTEIKEMDKSELTSVQIKQLRNEVLTIQKQLKPMNGGIYISVGGIIIILLLLILIF